MSTPVFLEAELPAPTDDGDDTLEHLYCCDVNTALCGADLTAAAYNDTPDPQDECVVCYALDDVDADCRTCGR